MNKLKEFENKYPYCWLILGLVLTLFSYGLFNTGICAWIFAIPLIRFINKNLKWSSILQMLIGMIIVANITFFRLVEDNFSIMNQVYCTYNGIRMWFPFFVYFLCRYFGAKKIISYYAFPATVAVGTDVDHSKLVGIDLDLVSMRLYCISPSEVYPGINNSCGVPSKITVLAYGGVNTGAVV